MTQVPVEAMTPKPIANPDLPAPPTGKYPAKAHARRVARWIADNGGPTSGVIYLEGQSEKIVEVGAFGANETDRSL